MLCFLEPSLILYLPRKCIPWLELTLIPKWHAIFVYTCKRWQHVYRPKYVLLRLTNIQIACILGAFASWEVERVL